MKQLFIITWTAMVATTVMIIVAFMQGNMTYNLQNVTVSMASNTVTKIGQSHIFLRNGHFYGDSSARETQDGAVLTLFTTFEESYNKTYIHKNVLRNWGLLSPDVIPVLFTDINVSSSVVEFARQRKWYIFPAPKRSEGGIPILRHMFLEVQQLFDTPFYGYANADILFDRRLTDTIHGLIRLKKNLTNLLVVGRRRNWQVKWQQNVTGLEEIGKNAKFAPLFLPSALDYFISTRDGYPWSNIPDFVVGRVKYDIWIMVTALKWGIPMVDATMTITALHQTDANGNKEGSKATVENTLNTLLAGNMRDSLGFTYCIPFQTNRISGSIIIQERANRNGNRCHGERMPHVTSPFYLAWSISNFFTWWR